MQQRLSGLFRMSQLFLCFSRQRLSSHNAGSLHQEQNCDTPRSAHYLHQPMSLPNHSLRAYLQMLPAFSILCVTAPAQGTHPSENFTVCMRQLPFSFASTDLPTHRSGIHCSDKNHKIAKRDECHGWLLLNVSTVRPPDLPPGIGQSVLHVYVFSRALKKSTSDRKHIFDVLISLAPGLFQDFRYRIFLFHHRFKAKRY